MIGILLKADCAHCVLGSVLNVYLDMNPKQPKSEVLAGLLQLVAEFIVSSSADSEDMKRAADLVFESLPEAILSAVKAMPTLTPSGKPS
jgi:hypothetical protein